MKRSTSGAPAVTNRQTDIEIPRNVWSAWTPSDGSPKQLRRELTLDEITALLARRAELEPIVAPYDATEKDQVALAVMDMYGGFTSMRQGEEEAFARADAVMRLLEPFPAWAIAKACGAIQRNGVWRDGKFDRRWPPNDSEIVHAVREESRLYADQYRNADALLNATVEQ